VIPPKNSIAKKTAAKAVIDPDVIDPKVILSSHIFAGDPFHHHEGGKHRFRVTSYQKEIQEIHH
jgi:hypothetical protein